MTDTPRPDPQVNVGDVLREAATGLAWQVHRVTYDDDMAEWRYWCVDTVHSYNRTWRAADLEPRVTIARRAEPGDPHPALRAILNLDSLIAKKP